MFLNPIAATQQAPDADQSLSPSQTAGKVFREALADHWHYYLAGTLALLVTSVTEVLAPKYVQWTVDLLTHGGEGRAAKLTQFMLGLGTVYVIGMLGRVAWRQTLARRSHQAGRDLKVRMWNVLREQPLKMFHRFTLGDLMNRAIGDLHASRAIHGFTIVVTFDMVFFAVLGAAAMLQINLELGLYCLIVFPLLPRFVVKLAKQEYDQHHIAQERLSTLSDLISQSLASVRLQRATASEGPWQARLAAESREYSTRRFTVLATGLKMFPLGAFPTLVAYAILLVLGFSRIKAGELTVGGFVALQSYVLLLQVPLFELGEVISEWQRGFASLRRIVEIFNLGQRVTKPTTRDVATARGGHALAVSHLSFRYEDGTEDVLRDLSFEVREGERLGIAGPIGSGKSTLLKALSGLVDVAPGKVALFGRRIEHMPRQAITENVAVVPQRAFLFAGSVRYNLVLNETFDDEALWKVLDVVQLAQDLRAFPQGLDTWIGEWGVTLSGGQKQRLALARALLRPKPLLLMDDALSAVDAVNEEAILRNMSTMLGGRTIIWVAHRQSTLKLCDRVFTLDRGKLETTR